MRTLCQFSVRICEYELLESLSPSESLIAKCRRTFARAVINKVEFTFPRDTWYLENRASTLKVKNFSHFKISRLFWLKVSLCTSERVAKEDRKVLSAHTSSWELIWKSFVDTASHIWVLRCNERHQYYLKLISFTDVRGGLRPLYYPLFNVARRVIKWFYFIIKGTYPLFLTSLQTSQTSPTRDNVFMQKGKSPPITLQSASLQFSTQATYYGKLL